MRYAGGDARTLAIRRIAATAEGEPAPDRTGDHRVRWALRGARADTVEQYESELVAEARFHQLAWRGGPLTRLQLEVRTPQGWVRRSSRVVGPEMRRAYWDDRIGVDRAGRSARMAYWAKRIGRPT